MKCSDPACEKTATRELLGVAMCDEYYIEALEHGANIAFRNIVVDRYVGLTPKGLPISSKFITFNQWLAQPETPAK